MIQAIAFDWGGIFTEGTFDAGAVHDLALRAGMDEQQVAATYYPLMERFEVGAFDMTTFHQRFVEGTGAALEQDEFEATFLGAVRERTAMYAVLGAIPQRYRVAVLSNNVEVLCDRVRRDPRMRRVEHWLFSNEIGARKPAEPAFAALRDVLALPPEAIVFVDDSAANVDACRALGFRGVHLETLDGFLETWRSLFPDVPTGIQPGT